jgi:hypothetical protein
VRRRTDFDDLPSTVRDETGPNVSPSLAGGKARPSKVRRS